MTYSIGVIAGDGIGPEVVEQALKVLDATGVETSRRSYDLGADRYLRTKETLPDEELAELDKHHAIMLGAVGDPRVPPGVLERDLLLKLRFAFDLYVNLRPVKLYPNVPTPLAGRNTDDIDMLVIRENSEGLYAHPGTTKTDGTAVQESINTRHGVERIIRFAFEQATKRRNKLTLCHKTNVLLHAGALYENVFEEVGTEFPRVARDYVHVDAACMYMVTDPARFDVIVTDNMFGDILTDLGAAIAGGIGFAASGNINPTRAHPSVFEPVHGSAPDIANKGWANPIAGILSVAMLLEHLGEHTAAQRVEDAAVRTLGKLRAMAGPEMGFSTTEMGDMVAEAI